MKKLAMILCLLVASFAVYATAGSAAVQDQVDNPSITLQFQADTELSDQELVQVQGDQRIDVYTFSHWEVYPDGTVYAVYTYSHSLYLV